MPLTWQDALITDPAQKVVTDQAVLNHLAKAGVSKDDVEFKYDYSKVFPYSKMYQNKKTGEHIVAISQLPMVRPTDGEFVKVGFILDGGRYRADINLFECTVSGTEVTLKVLSDQPNGAKAGDSATWNPQVFLDGEEQEAVSGPTLLALDPVNGNYQNNTLEWDYGICKRRIRIIEGRFRERWIFERNPGDEVKIKHNKTGTLPVRIGVGTGGVLVEVVDDGDSELVREASWNDLVFPIEVHLELTVYPDAHAETNTVDGPIFRNENETWAAKIAAANGTYAGPSDASEQLIFIRSSGTTDYWSTLSRIIFLFNTASLGSTAVISAATLSLYGTDKYTYENNAPKINIYSSNPASNTDLVNGDYDSLGSTAFSTGILFSGWSTSGYNDFALNSSGLAAISKTSITKFGARESEYDAGAAGPTWVSGESYGYLIRMCFAEQGTGYKPKLVITYLKPPTVTTVTPAENITETAARITGNVTDTGGENPSARVLEWGKTTGYELGSSDKGGGGTGTFYHDLSGLEDGTTYHYRARATNSAGTGTGTDQTFQTLAGGQPMALRYRNRMHHGGNRNIVSAGA